MDEERRTYVQRDASRPAGTVAWSEHVEAHDGYEKRFGRGGQTAERISERGGFSYGELVLFLGRDPETWRPS